MTVSFAELQNLNPSAEIELFVLDLTIFGAGLFYFHAGTNNLGQNIVWQGQTYVRFPITASNFSYATSGPNPRPKLVVSNFMSVVTALLLEHRDLVGAKVIRKRTLKKYLDAVNFVPGVNPTADPDEHYSDDIFYIERKVNESQESVEFELSSPTDLNGIQFPRRQVIQNACPWRYRGAECGYSDNRYFDKNDNPTSDPNSDSCSKRFEACKLRFPDTQPFGGFPSSGLVD